ncbi:LysR family transcriptional regulator [Rhodobacter capsulatus]|jgi:DNA-binding transcriptional LysR family regulator|uniref:Transcriptional regulator, LysR family n=1 Tax=Rhodobacter capsulatus (strain ATCC BAA-309 / NBRC 16581 / SB1003) TaxID=272942 RepID=D5AVL7_RHOCB|nr:LysR family transcriptional regulator [Rhodobacter capsulatus]ADE87352.1 transcriptional regulator, LysR family [Rhodobacter capsulatus SB 1003]ETE52107.1 LysR family transcriptional regulator [Rhodobacter capsulatus Y262]MDS0927569.1 LysR family transcriptional regulator [Rhodobacter capsulatus]
MRRDEMGDLIAFLAVAEERSFTRAAARLGTSQSAVSAVVRRLEERLDVRLLTRTTRSVSVTEAGQRLVDALRPAFDGIEAELAALDDIRARPQGMIRLTASRHAAERIVMPVANRLMADYPEVRVEILLDQRFVDIAKEGFDAGIRLGESVDRDMIGVRISGDLQMVVAGSPAYFARHPAPQTPQDLTAHNCINLRLPTLGGLYAWEFEKDGRPLTVRVEGQFTTNDPELAVAAALEDRGLVCLMTDYLAPHLASGRLVRVLADWCPPFSGYHLYYPSRRQITPAFRLLIDALRWRG